MTCAASGGSFEGGPAGGFRGVGRNIARGAARSLFHEAGVLSGRTVRSLDSLHLATAMRLDAAIMLAYDKRLLAAARELGLETRSPA